MKGTHSLAVVLFGAMALVGLVIGLMFASSGDVKPAITMWMAAAGLGIWSLIASKRGEAGG
jgi:hypothetical protein